MIADIWSWFPYTLEYFRHIILVTRFVVLLHLIMAVIHCNFQIPIQFCGIYWLFLTLTNKLESDLKQKTKDNKKHNGKTQNLTYAESTMNNP